MQVSVVAGESFAEAFALKVVPGDMRVQYAVNLQQVEPESECIFFLHDEEVLMASLPEIEQCKQNVFVHAVVTTLPQLPANCIRINAWPGFWERSIMEVAAHTYQVDLVAQVFGSLQWKYQLVADVPGLIAARIVATIINEAYYAVAENISSRRDLDIAMKLGTNYPYGPFEWSQKIGLRHILELLEALAQNDDRYKPCLLMMEESKI